MRTVLLGGLVLIAVVLVKRPDVPGWVGERITSAAVSSLLDKRTYRRIDDVRGQEVEAMRGSVWPPALTHKAPGDTVLSIRRPTGSGGRRSVVAHGSAFLPAVQPEAGSPIARAIRR